MSICRLEVRGVNASAEGKFGIMDHIEGCPGDRPWVASGVLTGQKFLWNVSRKSPDTRGFCFEGERGEPIFTLIPSVNDAIKAFVTAKLDHVIVELEKNPLVARIVDRPRVFEGPIHQYTGPCVCEVLASSDAKHPFDWNRHTNQGQFPKNCFECTCGCRWYRIHEEMWVHIGDYETWHVLTVHDGETVETMAFDPEREDVPTLKLLKNIRKCGFIPIG